MSRSQLKQLGSGKHVVILDIREAFKPTVIEACATLGIKVINAMIRSPVMIVEGTKEKLITLAGSEDGIVDVTPNRITAGTATKKSNKVLAQD